MSQYLAGIEAAAFASGAYHKRSAVTAMRGQQGEPFGPSAIWIQFCRLIVIDVRCSRSQPTQTGNRVT